MATDQTDDEGNIKPRQTANPGKSGDSLPFKGKCAPNSLNGMTDFEALPDIDYFSLRALAHEAATLMCAGEKLISIASDAESWYEQIPRRCFDTLCTYRWTTTRGMFRDPRNIFGFRAEPLNTQRISFLNRYAGHREAMKLQRQREKENSLPPTTMVFAQIRRAAGMSGAIFSNGWFFDDSGSVVGLDTSQNTEVDPTPAPAPMASSEEETFFCSPGEELRARRSPQIEALGKPATVGS
eukprot:COSAG01_NODE_7662_length_3108_cov_18.545696_2_plen_239_part_00